MAKDAGTDVEERPVEKAELTAGVKRGAGDPVVLLLGGVPGSGEPEPSSAAPADPSGAGEPSGAGSVAALAAKIHDPPDAAGKKGREATPWNVPPK